ncbi:MAG: FtsX-like permease family protein [Candidatus Aminicenantes bacterium]|nr:FtsX-like permease family protein [Candidatus Aminicenantes bacterium]
MTILRLALRNIIGTGIRAWLNALIISIGLVAATWNQGLVSGMDEQAAQASQAIEYGGGQFWHERYDPYDPLTLEDAHAPLPPALQELVDNKKATAILVVQGSIYPHGRMRSLLLKGIDPGQGILNFATASLADNAAAELPILIGERMARAIGLTSGEVITLRWREPRGAFNAQDATVTHIMKTTVSTIDNNQVWLPLAKLQAMARLPGQATLVVLAPGTPPPGSLPGWIFRDSDYLMRDLRELVKTKSYGRVVFLIIFLSLGMLAIFDTQVLAIFRRRREIGTLVALGFTRGQVIRLFTLEGALHGVLAVILGALYGLPLLWLQARAGFAVPAGTEDMGISIGERIYPVYSAGLTFSIILIAMVVTTIVSIMPTRRIARLKPTDALRGRMS